MEIKLVKNKNNTSLKSWSDNYIPWSGTGFVL